MKKILLVAAATLLFAACHRDPHFITDRDYRNTVHADFEVRMADFPMLLVQLDTLSAMEREAMEFLYAYMPLSDLADYEPSFYLNQVRYAFKAREEMPWGKDVPEDIFRHFVLVYRVNNENLDTARMVFYRELKDRVKGLSMEEAALEVNHWCHEHVAYRASDSRTSAPLATMRTSLGRCGEESTFTVTAMRAVGIPARQCYTPRWAHCDDNHAWVEVYVDGEWKFLGACEPDPRLNMGWFSVPSTRCMMVHTKAFGKYKGDEEVVKRTSLYSELNLLSHYAPTRRVTVTVVDVDGAPLDGAQVKFKLYNYAEYYTLATMTTDKEGKASLTTGLGDLLIWASDGERYTFEKLDVRQDSTLTLALTHSSVSLTAATSPNLGEELDERGSSSPSKLEGVAEGQGRVFTFEMVPPVVGEPQVIATEEETAANAKRLAYEDSLRNAYTATFPTKDDLQRMDGIQYLNKAQKEMLWELVHKSEGNHEAILTFISKHGLHEEQFGPVYDYLSTFSDKDLRDITSEVLEVHYTTYDWDWIDEQDCPVTATGVYYKGILPARISNEMVRPYREELASFKGMTAEEIKHWVMDSINVDDSGNYYNCPVSPVGVYKLRRADSHSRDIFFVAACRAAEVPAYLDNATNRIYVWENANWVAKDFKVLKDSKDLKAAKLTLTHHGKEPAKPVYWSHFTLAKLENGDLRTFDFEDDARMESFPATIELEPGVYCLSTGNRYPDGAVRSRMEFFEVKAGEKVTKEIVILPLLARTDELGVLDKNLELFDGIELWDYAGDAGMLYVNLGDYSEPSKHLIVELKQHQKEMKQWGGMTFMVGPANIGMPSWGLVNTDFAYKKGQLEQRIHEAVRGNGHYPIVALINKDGHILYHSEGYKIGVIEQVLKAAK
ncbi:MAG: transglutaminase domain-containing protein [Bacteroidales bacterium]|nr:transglutaminase domain-containing protein [Bacteroidales bacterium]